MHLDVLDLRNFYYRTGLGRTAQRAIRGQVTTLLARGGPPDGRGISASRRH